MNTKRFAGAPLIEWKIAGGIFVVGALAALSWFFFASASPQPLRPTLAEQTAERMAEIGHPGAKVTNEDALRLCQKTITQAARDPETAVVPDVGWMKGGVDWRFSWNQNSRLVRMKSGLGLEVGATALCVVDEAAGHIKLLVVDGVQLIGPKASQ